MFGAQVAGFIVGLISMIVVVPRVLSKCASTSQSQFGSRSDNLS